MAKFFRGWFAVWCVFLSVEVFAQHQGQSNRSGGQDITRARADAAPRVNDKRLVKKTLNGSEFQRIPEEELSKLGITNPKAFGEAWQDPSGMIWGDVKRLPDGSPRTMNHSDAEAYCKKLGAELPSGYEINWNGTGGYPNRDSDFVRLSKYMGAKYVFDDRGRKYSDKGYSPQILPNLTYEEDGKTKSAVFWSSSVNPRTGVGSGFYGQYATFVSAIALHNVDICSVRCVIKAK